MGWVGLSGPSGAYAAKVNGDPVLLTEWEEQYKRTYRQYQTQLGDQFSPELMESINLKMQVLVGLIDRKLWLALGRDTGLAVSDAEVRKALMDIPAFQSNGRFSSRVYLEVLQRIHTTPEAFEAGIREDLLSAKIQSLIASAARLTDADRASLEPGDEGQQADQAAGLLNRKQSQLVLAYATRMREQAKIRIFRENLDLQPRQG
jgi:peptidyl-prolyl cis-trans isomerase D